MSLPNIEYQDKLRNYVLQMRPVFKPNALFSDETENYVTPMEPDPGDTVTIRFRGWKDNIDAVYFISGSMRLAMSYEKTEGNFDYFKIRLVMEKETIHYFFEVHAGKIRCFYNKRGVSKDLQDYYAFTIAPGFHTPDWAKGAVMYQIYVDRFYNGDPTNDVENREYYYIGDYAQKVTDWKKNPAFMGVREFYGGDLQGVMEKLDYLQDLGVDVIYFNPIFVSPSNHKYDIQDYDYVDPHYGKIVNDGGTILGEGDILNAHASKYIQRVTDKANLESSNTYFVQLVEEIHRRGMKIILDGVFNHCGSFNKWLDRERIYERQQGYEPGAYISADSPYRSFFKFNNEHDWPYNPFYDGWWGHDTLPKLYYEQSPKLYDYIMEIGRKWVSPPFNADGWRLDVAADLGFSNEYNHKFWKEFRKNVKEANPNAIILAEHYGDPGFWLRGDEWDTVMNYDAFMEPLTWFFTGMEKHSDEYRGDLLGNAEAFTGAMSHHMSNFLAPSLQTAMNELSNHDHSRFLTRTNHKVGRVANLGYEAASENVDVAVMREAVVMQMTWPGAPTIYYGDEAGVCGFTDPDNRRTYPWGEENQELIAFHKDMIQIHKKYPVLIHGSLKFLEHGHNMISYGRFSAEEQVVVAFNNDKESHKISISVWQVNVPLHAEMERVMLTDAEGYTTESAIYPVETGEVEIELPGTSAIVLYRKTV
ncbi:MAG: glycoside hydrolase family 13 protein [Lachnospiraceae bacterium]|nr:glycoside hydrolase family 13 protein [Lachnospiraceae bacterium]